MSTQYDNIGAAYDDLTQLAPEQIEHANVEKIIEPHIRGGANVLELACGLGRYARRMIDLGADHVVAVDISPGMIEAAGAKSAAAVYNRKIDYQVADCQRPQRFGTDDGSFDLVLAAWLLNYAPTAAVLADTFRTASLNLKPGGLFVGSTVFPTDDPAGFYRSRHAVRPRQRGIVFSEDAGTVQDGIKLHVTAVTAEREEDCVQFDCFHLREEVFARAAREGGFAALEWRELEMPEPLAGTEQEDWLRGFVTMPECGVFVARK